ncbi:MAG: hypothetical protein RLZZ196_3314 [Bacteroidota bacterium]|jgi:DNA (cytosine-5)-methyltransferase 1
MNHGSLFSGIGGFDLAAEWMGWNNIFHCEWNQFGQQVLKYHFPNSISYADITKTDFSIHRGTIDILTGGFPCQPYSTAGKRLGKADERHLFPEMLRAIKEIQPKWIIGENVLGLVSWNGGMVFHEVQDDLERQGYEVQSFLIPAASVNAPHRRERVWFIAHSKCTRLEYRDKATNISKKENKTFGKTSKFTDEFEATCSKFNSTEYTNLQTEQLLCRGYDGISERLDKITFSKWRKESIKAYGNAIVPQVALQIFKAIQQFENETT